MVGVGLLVVVVVEGGDGGGLQRAEGIWEGEVGRVREMVLLQRIVDGVHGVVWRAYSRAGWVRVAALR